MNVYESLLQRLIESGHGPFLFLGSGFSSRYIGLETWDALLRRFTYGIKDFEYYLSSSNSELALASSKIAIDYKDYWWTADATIVERQKYKAEARYISSPLKISISEYVKAISACKIPEDSPHATEISELSKANVDGILTTNWDLLAETLFPDYKVYIGQEELLVSTPQNIGEIYKIHGCCTKPNTLVLTHEDYQRFEHNNPYLAAKLITIFVENPVLFIGYRLNDPNILQLLDAIVRGIGTKNIDKIQKNLIFVQRQNENRSYGFHQSVVVIGDYQIPVTLLVTSDFSEIYRALQGVEHKIPTRVLRYCKNQLYSLVHSTKPSDTLCVVDVDEIDDSSKVEFVIGVGIKERLSEKGYEPISLRDIMEDILLDNKHFNAKALIDTTIVNYLRNTKYVPVFKYLSDLKITTQEKYVASGLKLRCISEFKTSDFRNAAYSRFFVRECRSLTFEEIVDKYPADKAAQLLPFIPWKDINAEKLKEFLLVNLAKLDKYRYATYYKKLLCLYDGLVYGWLF